jgi:putative sterol carrier protein
MSEKITEFFEQLEQHVDPERLEGIDATYRFDVGEDGSWRVEIADCKVRIEESTGDADCVVRASTETFDKIVRGKQNPATAVMLGKLKIEGDMTLALKLKQLF